MGLSCSEDLEPILVPGPKEATGDTERPGEQHLRLYIVEATKVEMLFILCVQKFVPMATFHCSINRYD